MELFKINEKTNISEAVERIAEVSEAGIDSIIYFNVGSNVYQMPVYPHCSKYTIQHGICRNLSVIKNKEKNLSDLKESGLFSEIELKALEHSTPDVIADVLNEARFTSEVPYVSSIEMQEYYPSFCK